MSEPRSYRENDDTMSTDPTDKPEGCRCSTWGDGSRLVYESCPRHGRAAAQREHEARIRADERARAERDIANHVVRDFSDVEDLVAEIRASQYPKGSDEVVVGALRVDMRTHMIVGRDYPKADPEPAPAPVERRRPKWCDSCGVVLDYCRSGFGDCDTAYNCDEDGCDHVVCFSCVPIHERRAHGVALADMPAPAPVDWVDGKATVGACSLTLSDVEGDILWHVSVYKPDEHDPDDDVEVVVSCVDDDLAKRLAIAVARALAETGRTP